VGCCVDGWQIVRLQEQPPNIKFGTMKKYQLEGLNWMIRLYENNVNGILAGASQLLVELDCFTH
jgi:SNF2 family DNA or RNA helicase